MGSMFVWPHPPIDLLLLLLFLLFPFSGSEQDRLASKTLYVGNIPYGFREAEVESLFKKYGTIVKITVVLDQHTGRNKGYNDKSLSTFAQWKITEKLLKAPPLCFDWETRAL